MTENRYQQELEEIEREIEREIDLRTDVELVEIIVALDALSSQINALWSSALARQDFDEVTRIVEASHAIHRAALALEIDDSRIARDPRAVNPTL